MLSCEETEGKTPEQIMSLLPAMLILRLTIAAGMAGIGVNSCGVYMPAIINDPHGGLVILSTFFEGGKGCVTLHL